MITSSQLRAARALLDWTRSDCGKITGLSPETIRNIEQEKFIPSSSTVEKILNGFAAYGIEFFALRGVAMKKDGLCVAASQEEEETAPRQIAASH